ncbi:MAG: hypothetical protein Q8936_12015 [Bacillota bacterium]|nr:hypothetical protein [Bacillota bacterium]
MRNTIVLLIIIIIINTISTPILSVPSFIKGPVITLDLLSLAIIALFYRMLYKKKN